MLWFTGSQRVGHNWATELNWTELLLSPGSQCTKLFVCPLSVYIPVLRKLYCGVNGDLLQEGLCHPQVCCTQRPPPVAVHCWPGPPQEMLKQFCLSLCGVPESWSAQGLLEPSEHLWLEWGLILTANLPLPPSCLGLLLCPWTWTLSSRLVYQSAVAAPDLNSPSQASTICEPWTSRCSTWF